MILWCTLWWMSLLLSGCVSPVAMHRAVLEYDWTVNRIETELLLLNIARTRYHEPIHFTAVSNIAATFDFRGGTSQRQRQRVGEKRNTGSSGSG